MFLHNKPTETITVKPLHYDISVLGHVISFFADGDPRRNGPLSASLTDPPPDSVIYTNVSGFPKPHDQPEASESVPSSPEQPGVFYSSVICNSDSKGVALITDSDAVMYSTIKITQ